MKHGQFKTKLIATLAILVLLGASAVSAQQLPLPGTAIPKFVEQLPTLHAIPAGTGTIELQMTEMVSNILPANMPLPSLTTPVYAGTHVWSYLEPGQVTGSIPIPSYIGPVIVAQRGLPTEVKWVNNLGTTAASNVLAYTQSTDKTLHWADPNNEGMVMGHYAGSIPAVTHLHGGEVPPCRGILKLMDELDDRKAHFSCCIGCLLKGGKEIIVTEGVKGRISAEEKGSQGFGFDPIFVPDGESRTFAEIGIEEKNPISHRGRAIRAFAMTLTGKVERIK